MMLQLALALLAAQPSIATVSPDPAAVDRVASSKYWLRLLHFHGSKSDVDGPKFFLAPNGRQDPKAELLASLEGFQKEDKKENYVGREDDKLQHPQCAFPERFRYLTEELKLSIPKVPCPLYDQYMSKFKPEGTTLVFSAAYPYNPGSMFGHTFLRINSNQASADGKFQKKMELLDHGLSYAASVANDDNSIGFMWNGLTGGFTGNFTILPYYMKVNEYNNSESRDLWEYELDLNAEQTTRLLAHTWELEMNGTFNYYFFTANCSYQLLGLLEVARPDWNLTEGWVHVIPSETVKAVVRVPGAVRSVHFRPSLYKKAKLKIRELNDEQRKTYEGLLDGSVAETKDLVALTTAISYFYYQKQKNNGHLNEDTQKRFEKILIARSKVPAADPADPDVPGTSRPDLGHFSNRLGTAAGILKRGTAGKDTYFQDLHIRPAYHDLLNDDRGFTPFGEIALFGLKGRYVPDDKRLMLEELNLASIVSLTPWTSMELPISWRVKAGYYRVYDTGCFHCHAALFEIGAGMSTYLDPAARALMLFVMAKVKAEAGGGLPRQFRFNQGAEAGFLASPWAALKLEAAAQLYTDFFWNLDEKTYTQLRFQLGHSLGNKWDLRVSHLMSVPQKNAALRYRETQVGANFYF